MIFYIFLIIFLLSITSFFIFLFKHRNQRSNIDYDTFNLVPCGSGGGEDESFKDKFFKIISGIVAVISFIMMFITCDIPKIEIYPNMSDIGYGDEIKIDGFMFPVYYATKGQSVKENGQKYQESFFINNEDIVEGKYKINVAYKIFGFVLPFWKSEIEYDIIESSKPKFMNFECNFESKMSYEDLHYNITDGNCHTSSFWTYTNESYIMFSNSSDDLEKISHIYINNGNGESKQSYASHSRPSKIKLEFSDGKEEVHMLNDTIETQLIKLDMVHETSYIKISILNVFPGDVSDEFYISDVFFYR